MPAFRHSSACLEEKRPRTELVKLAAAFKAVLLAKSVDVRGLSAEAQSVLADFKRWRLTLAADRDLGSEVVKVLLTCSFLQGECGTLQRLEDKLESSRSLKGVSAEIINYVQLVCDRLNAVDGVRLKETMVLVQKAYNEGLDQANSVAQVNQRIQEVLSSCGKTHDTVFSLLQLVSDFFTQLVKKVAGLNTRLSRVLSSLLTM